MCVVCARRFDLLNFGNVSIGSALNIEHELNAVDGVLVTLLPFVSSLCGIGETSAAGGHRLELVTKNGSLLE